MEDEIGDLGVTRDCKRAVWGIAGADFNGIEMNTNAGRQ